MVSVLPSCVPAQQSEERREGRAQSPPACCTPCDFCFIACGCIKPQSNNLVSSGAETTNISHGAAARHHPVPANPQQLLADTFPCFRSFVQLSHVIHQVKSSAFACIVFQAQCLGWPRNGSSTDKCTFKARYALYNVYYITEGNIQKPTEDCFLMLILKG